MFTGLIETVGRVRSMRRGSSGARLEVQVSWPGGELPRLGDSIAVNGACLTAVASSAEGFASDVSSETLQRTLLGELRSGAELNLERALRLGDRLGGHLVQGHVDGVTRVEAIIDEGGFSRWRFALPRPLANQVAEKGSVAIHGVSLTVASLFHDSFEVAVIPETSASTVFRGLRVGARVHLETDVLAKYVARCLGEGGGGGGSLIDEVFGGGGGGA